MKHQLLIRILIVTLVLAIIIISIYTPGSNFTFLLAAIVVVLSILIKKKELKKS